MPFYVRDYLADTGDLSTLEHGAYLLLIMHYWQRGSLPDDNKKLASIARASPEQWADIRPNIEGFFAPGWRHERVDDELEKARKAYEKRAAAGRAGGNAKAVNKQSSSNATSMPEQSATNHNHIHIDSYPASQHSYGGAGLDVVEARRGELYAALGVTDETRSPGLLSLSDPIRWVEAGCDVDADIIPALRVIAARGKAPRSWSYCSDAVFEQRDRRIEPPPDPKSRPPPATRGRKDGPVAALGRFMEKEHERERNQGEGNDPDAERVSSDDGKLRSIAGFIHAAIGEPID
nr:DUF1376 domain-containing protein [Mesorhizobium loti]